jgi:hypothetical protein
MSAVRCFLSRSWRCLPRSVLFRLGWLFSDSSSFSSSMIDSLVFLRSLSLSASFSHPLQDHVRALAGLLRRPVLLLDVGQDE